MRIVGTSRQDQIAPAGRSFSPQSSRNSMARPVACFGPTFGDKWPSADFLVECYDAGPVAPIFFVQVRATQQPYLTGGGLKIHLDADHVRGLTRYPTPTYIVGVHEPSDAAYIVSANGDLSDGLRSLPTRSMQQHARSYGRKSSSSGTSRTSPN
jgi:hypothetical protein